MYRLKRENASSTDGKVTVQADKDKFKINIDGKSTQATRSGKNKLENIGKSQTINGLTFTVNEDKTILVNGTATAKAVFYIKSKFTLSEGDYIFNGCPKGGSNSTYFLETYTGKIYPKDIGSGNKFSVTEDNSLSIYIVVNSGITMENMLFKPMIRLASVSDDTYEPYGASPSPEFPSEIKSVGDEGTVTIEQRGKNLYNKNGNLNYPSTFNQNKTTLLDNGTIKTTANYSQWASTGYQLKNIIQNTDYTLSGRLVSSTGAGSSVIASVIVYGYSNNKWNGIGIGHLTKVGVFNIKFNSGTYSDFFISLNANGTIGTSYEAIFENIQVEKNSEATDYEPYFSKDYVIPLSAPLRSLPNGTKDTIEEDGIHRRVRHLSLAVSDMNGSENYPGWSNLSQLKEDLGSNYNTPVFPVSLRCNILKDNTYLGLNTKASSSLFLNKSAFNLTQTEWKEQYPNLVVEIDYELSEEVVEPFTYEQQAVLNSMITEKGTNIFDINEDTGITINYTPEFTDEIKHAFRYGVTRGYLEVLDGSELIINEDNYLQSIDFDDERYVDGEGIIGTTVAKSLEGKFVNVDSEFSVENKELQAYIGAELDDGTTKYIDLGTFIVQKPDNDNVKDNTSFTSLDYMVKFNQTYKDTITYPCTLGQLLQNVCDQVGIVLGTKTFRNSNFLVENNQFVNNESCREVLKAIAQMAFSWARINQDNELVLDFNLIDEPTAEFDYDEYYDLTSNEQYGPVNTIILKNSQVEGENYTVKNQDLIDEAGKEIALTISDNPFAYTQAKRSQLIQAGKELFGFKYIPFTAKTIGYIYLNCQDKIRIKNMQDKLLDSYLFNNKFSYEGSISDNKETSAMTETETKYQFTDTVEKKLNAKIARTEIIVDKANQEITAVVEKQTEYDKSLTEIKAGLGSVTSTVEEIKNFKRSKRSTNEIYITDAMEDGTLSFTAIGNESVNVVLFPLNNLYPSDDLYGGNEYDG